MVLVLDRQSAAGRAFFGNLPFFATYTSNWCVNFTNERVIFFFAWSLATEEQFYLFWPTIEKRLGSRGAVLSMLAILAVASVAMAGGLKWLLVPGTLGSQIVTSFPVPIGLGVLLAHLLHEERGYRLAALALGRRASAPLALLVLGLAVFWARSEGWSVSLAMTALVGSVVIREDHLLAPLLRWRPIAHMGVVSYGMYLLHMLALNVVRRVLERLGISQPWAPLFGTLALSLAAASLSYRYYESFFLRLKDRYGPAAGSRVPAMGLAAAVAAPATPSDRVA
jgi:peptidoglycan/LPS O-acetylase OafA/YrhL